jgi:hypothetical protein
MKKYARYYKECMGVDYNGKKTYREGIVVESGGDKKLFDLENLEEELGFNLITLFKALKNGIYGKVGSEIKHILAPHFSWFKKEIYIFRLADYGKTWALTREELERKEEGDRL